MFTKKDLRSGDVCIRRNGDRRIYIDTGEFGVLVDFAHKCLGCGKSKPNGWGSIDSLSEDLRNSDPYSPLDIMKVFRPTCVEAVIGAFSADLEKNEVFNLVFDRNEPVEMTLAEVCEALCKNIKIVKEH